MLPQDEIFKVSEISPDSLKTVNDCLREAKVALGRLRQRAAVLNLKDNVARINFAENVAYVKLFYVRAERILLNDNAK